MNRAHHSFPPIGRFHHLTTIPVQKTKNSKSNEVNNNQVVTCIYNMQLIELYVNGYKARPIQGLELGVQIRRLVPQNLTQKT